MGPLSSVSLRTASVLLVLAALAVPARAQLVVNEVDYDQPGTDTAEFIEIKNVSSDPVDLSLYRVRLVNGADTSVYRTITPTGTLAAGGYYVICANPANTPNCNLDHATNTDLIQNGAPDAVAIILFSDSSIVDTVSYEGSTGAPYTETSGSGLEDTGTQAGASISRFPDGADTGINNVDLSLRCATPGTANQATDDCCALCEAAAEIFQIQGNGLASPLADCRVTTNDNVVTALDANGFYMQTPDARADADAETSNGIFVFTVGFPRVRVGDVVDVVGTIQEFFEFTEVSCAATVSVQSSGAPLPKPVHLGPSRPSPLQPQAPTELERFEGMRVDFSLGTVTAPSDQFGDVPVVARRGRAFREPGIEYPGLASLPVWDGNPEIFDLDPDGLLLRDRLLNGGARVFASGVLGFAFGDYQVLPRFLRATQNPLPVPARPRTADEITIATQNLHQLFDIFDDPEKDEVILSIQEYDTKLAKLSRQVRDVLGVPQILLVQEAENLEVLQDLAARLQADTGVGYEPFLIEGNDIGGIDSGLLVHGRVIVDSVEQWGEDETFVFGGDTFLVYDRPPLVVQARVRTAAGFFPLTVIGVHLRSLSGIEDATDGPRVREKRHQGGLRLSQFIQSLQEADPDLHLVVAGDFNAFEFTDGYVDVMGQMTGSPHPAGALIPATDEVNPDLTNQVLSLPANARYSFVFQGSAQVLDHVLTSQALAPFVSGVTYARGNADAPLAWQSDAGTSLRSSDHDGLVLYLTLPSPPSIAPGRGAGGPSPAERR